MSYARDADRQGSDFSNAMARRPRPYPTASRVAIAALKECRLKARMVMGSPVVGCLPSWAGRVLVEDVPKPTMATVSPSASASPMAVNTTSTTECVAALDSDAWVATWEERSDSLEPDETATRSRSRNAPAPSGAGWSEEAGSYGLPRLAMR